MEEINAPHLIIGSEGQDGIILNNLLSKQGTIIYRQTKNLILGPNGKIIGSPTQNVIRELISDKKFEVIYFLAAIHSPAVTKSQVSVEFEFKAQSNLLSDLLLTVLGAIQLHSPQTKIFFSSSALIYGNPRKYPQNESTCPLPVEPYAIYKRVSQDIMLYFREIKNLFTVSGILFPHESEYRKDNFLFKKILNSARNISRGNFELLEIADLNYSREWNCAYQTMQAVMAVMELDEPGDYIVGSGIQKSVREICELAFDFYGLDLNNHVVSSGLSILPRSNLLIADPSKLRRAIGFVPDGDVRALVNRVSEKLQG